MGWSMSMTRKETLFASKDRSAVKVTDWPLFEKSAAINSEFSAGTIPPVITLFVSGELYSKEAVFPVKVKVKSVGGAPMSG